MKLLLLILLFISCSTHTVSPTLESQYISHMRSFPSGLKIDTCGPVNYQSHKNLRRFKTNLLRRNPNVGIPNYNGHYLLLENPLSMGSDWYVVDCRTGKYEAAVPAIGSLMFSKESRIIVSKTFGPTDTKESFQLSAYGLPKIMEWSGREWTILGNPIQ